MSWDEFSTLLAGILPETPLGQIVSVRCENNKDTLKNFTKEQHKIRNAWRNRRKADIDKVDAQEQLKMFQEMCRQAFGK